MPALPCKLAVDAGVVAGGLAGGGSCYFVKERWRRRNGNGAPSRFLAVRVHLSSSFLSSIRLDSQRFHTSDTTQLLIGPVPGDIAEIEAYIRIFRAVEKLQAAILDTLCNSEMRQCAVSYGLSSQDLLMLEEEVAAVVGCMLALVNRAREDVLFGRSSVMGSFQINDVNVIDNKLPPLALFRGEMKRCCESLQVLLSNCLPSPDECNREIWKWLQRLQNVCYDTGFPRPDEYPSPTTFANWNPVYFSRKEDAVLEDHDVAFWRGGQVTMEGLSWLLKNKFKTIVDLRETIAMDEYSQAAVNEAVLSGRVEVVNLAVGVGTAPSAEQVEQFSSLVMDPTRRPIYLQSKEGVGRTLAMVSRWRQFIEHHLSHSISGDMPSPNGRPTKDASHDECNSLQGVVSSETNSGTCLEYGDRFLLKRMTTENYTETCETQLNSSADVGDHNGSVKYEILSVNVNKLNSEVNDTDTDSQLKLNMRTAPIKVQFPTCNIFSKEEMTAFYKSRKLGHQTYITSCRSNLELLLTLNGLAKLPVQCNCQHGEQLFGRLYRKPGVGNSLSMNATNSTNEPATGDNFETSVVNGNCDSEDGPQNFTGNLDSSGKFENKLGEQTAVSSIQMATCETGDCNDPENENLVLVEEKMCASATGVVRVQSRKKSEMFLVRTDGFSCTREKVTEARMAFTHPSTQQQMLMWKSPPKTVLLLKKLGEALMEEAKEIASFLYYQEKMNVLVEPDVHDMFARIPGFGFVQTFYNQNASDLHDRVDFVTCLGGDGVILHASNLFRGPVPPVVSFNLGSLGFLASHDFSEYKNDLRAIIHGNNTLGVYITLRMRLHCEILRNGKAVPGKVFEVLNEVIVDRGSNPYLSKIECYEHNHLITKVQGDGVIVATPTGSTAYSTAAGGSMVHPNVPCMLFTPICPHSLSFRPVILPDSARLELKIPLDARNNAWVSFDGKRRQQLSRGDSVRISMSQHPLPTVNKADQTGEWFRSLIRCLNWNERLEQKAL